MCIVLSSSVVALLIIPVAKTYVNFASTEALTTCCFVHHSGFMPHSPNLHGIRIRGLVVRGQRKQSLTSHLTTGALVLISCMFGECGMKVSVGVELETEAASQL